MISSLPMALPVAVKAKKKHEHKPKNYKKKQDIPPSVST